MTDVVKRFLNYVKIYTDSDPTTGVTPSTERQKDLAKILVQELLDLGLEDAHMDDNCYVMATLPSNIDKKVPTVGFIAHMDTSPDFSGKDVKPRTIEDYDGKDIVLNEEQNIVMTTKDFPELLQYKGQDIIVTDGTTLLGADDKAGVAEIMSAVAYLVENPDIKHGTIKIGFTPDEEIGEGADHFDVEKFGADFAYTMDGGEIGELEFENFNAAGAVVTCKGRSVHPGYAKDKMVNSMLIAQEYMNQLPASEVPQKTEGYEGFYHLVDIQGSIEKTTLQYMIRDFDREHFENRKQFMKNVADQIAQKYGQEYIDIEIKDQYYNMREKVEPQMYIVDIARQAMEEEGIKPNVKAIRGGTDGARLSFMGLPCPNIFAGGHNFHGKFEYVPIPSMQKATKLIVRIAENIGKQ
ncbi:tripeptide aminopeptidase [Balneicella halophila]|uniref:Peptidase T n=1 Tax=Balneicella halophila TaxID=1537566 RepID=A0A7L4UQT3_BALHA|nr:peptidase T [Balneicella halophila]PVX51872.1 tripeptide aminopeptidase [Balneicella halophila]